MHHLSPARKVVAAVAGIAALQALMLLAFAWPAANSGPRELPIAVAGPEQVVGQVEGQLEDVRVVDDTAAFDVTAVADRAAAEEAILDRDVYGAIVVGQDGTELLIASGASPVVARLLQDAIAQFAPADASLTVTDLVPPDPDDPNGTGLAVSLLPLIMTSAAGGFAAVLLLRRAVHRAAVVVGLATVAGLAVPAILQYGLGVVDGSYWALAGVIALTVGAVSAAIAGLGSVLGRGGAALGALTMIFIGNPLSATTSAPEMLPQPWGEIGQWLPPGAGVTAERSAMFFDGAAIGTPLLVLSLWAGAGLLLIAVGAVVRRTSTDVDAADAQEPTRPRTIQATP